MNSSLWGLAMGPIGFPSLIFNEIRPKAAPFGTDPIREDGASRRPCSIMVWLIHYLQRDSESPLQVTGAACPQTVRPENSKDGLKLHS